MYQPKLNLALPREEDHRLMAFLVSCSSSSSSVSQPGIWEHSPRRWLSSGREDQGPPAALSLENDPRTGPATSDLQFSFLLGHREEEWQWGDWGVPTWGFQRWAVWSCCYFREARGPEDTSSPLPEPGGATVENWERARGGAQEEKTRTKIKAWKFRRPWSHHSAEEKEKIQED